MTPEETTVFSGVIVEEQTGFSLDELCGICSVEEHRIVELVNEDFEQPRPNGASAQCLATRGGTAPAVAIWSERCRLRWRCSCSIASSRSNRRSCYRDTIVASSADCLRTGCTSVTVGKAKAREHPVASIPQGI